MGAGVYALANLSLKWENQKDSNLVPALNSVHREGILK